jgi:SIR2-like domain
MERALEKANRPYELVVQAIDGFDADEQKDLMNRLSKPNGVILYKFHGTFPGAEPDPPAGRAHSRIIVTEEDYIKFLTVMGRGGEEGVPTMIKSRMIDSTLLFLGYSLEDWDFRTLFKGLIEDLPDKNRQYKSYAIQKNPPRFWQDVWARNNVTILNQDVHEFADELGRRWRQFTAQAEG